MNNQRTPLHEEHHLLNARMAPFAGWDMPIQYQGIIAEHLHTRAHASVFDICHMGEFELTGPTAEADLERLLSLRIATLEPGQCRYGFLLNEAGGVLDDLTCYRLGADRFWLVVNAATRTNDAAWIRGHVSDRTTFKDCSNHTAKLDVQGPESRSAMARALALEVPDLKYFHAATWDMNGLTCLLSRTGYTGEWGYELYFPAPQAAGLWRRLLSSGEIRAAGLGARDTLRLEVGYPLYGHEFSMDRTPVAAVGHRFMDLDKDFIGCAAVRRELEEGVDEVLTGLQFPSRRSARAGDAVYDGATRVGTVTSGSFAPSLGSAVALAYVRKGCDDPGTALDVESRGARLPCHVVSLPFYREGTARARGPGS